MFRTYEISEIIKCKFFKNKILTILINDDRVSKVQSGIHKIKLKPIFENEFHTSNALN
jgi:hypothetical protein